jgi:hypothetical protein
MVGVPDREVEARPFFFQASLQPFVFLEVQVRHVGSIQPRPLGFASAFDYLRLEEVHDHKHGWALLVAYYHHVLAGVRLYPPDVSWFNPLKDVPIQHSLLGNAYHHARLSQIIILLGSDLPVFDRLRMGIGTEVTFIYQFILVPGSSR